LLSKNEFYNFILNNSASSAQPNISPSFIESFEIILPPLPEQQKIAEILETIDNAIEKTDKIIEKYKRIKQGLMQDLLTKGIDENGNIRDEKTHKFKDSPLGRIPEEWEVVRLWVVIYFKNGKSPSFSETGIYPIYGSNGLIGFSNMYQFEGEHLIIGRVGASGEVHWVSGKFFASDNCLIGHLLREKELNLKYTFYYLKYFDLKRFITQTAQPLITQSLINSLFIPLPPLPEQQRIAEILSQIDEAIEKEEQYKEKLERIKKGLMEELLTGKLRVNNLIKED
jgi:type I restriction enzyme S subunit